MREQLRTALLNPCVEAEQCANPRYRTFIERRWSVIVTVNSGFE